MTKNFLISSYYLYLIYTFFTGSPSAFILLFSLVVELAFMAFAYTFLALRNPEKTYSESLNALYGAIPVILIQYFITCIISDSLNELPDGQFSLILPLVIFKMNILLMVIIAFITYSINCVEFIQGKYSFVEVEKSFVFRVLLLSVTGVTSLIFLSLFGNSGKLVILILIAGARIGFEFLINKKLKGIEKE
ncbi:hypothetical protein BH09BAC5_BH09BAC5_16090 [soil metagenome]